MSETTEFTPFPKMPRLSRDVVITEKIDGTNASIFIIPRPPIGSDITNVIAVNYTHLLYAGSRTRWITPDSDNFGFAAWAKAKAEELFKLGEGHHFGEWWGSGIQRGYGFKNGERFFSLFNASRWVEHDQPTYSIKNANPKAPQTFTERAPACCKVVPTLYKGIFDTEVADMALSILRQLGSMASPGFMDPEGIILYHIAGRVGFKKTIKDDDKAKGTL